VVALHSEAQFFRVLPVDFAGLSDSFSTPCEGFFDEDVFTEE
jgi:hypothetical protein